MSPRGAAGRSSKAAPPPKLAEYQRKRDFSKTAEPAGGTESRAAAGLSRFVVQKHAASRLHYDFRLEIGGVLASWAVPKGPSMDPADRRLAVHVEDHPIEYFDFEGIIPKGEYGGGTVMVWDWGGVRWHGDPEQMMRKGDIKFDLYGRKLKGAFALVGKPDQENWFLIKKRDDAARPGESITDQERSVLSGRAIEEIAAAQGRVWHSKESAGGTTGDSGLIDLGKARAAGFPSQIEPMLATPGKQPFDDPEWSYELKLDGFRVIALVHGATGRTRAGSSPSCRA
jgi:bifunctional non-homologous end joining protein LigD